MAGSSSSSGIPCAACKFLRRRCTRDCIFAPYFPPNEPQKFANVHKVFGASNVSKLLSEVAERQREDTVTSLAYEADARMRDPVYGCVRDINALQNQLLHLHRDLVSARTHLSHFGPRPSCYPSRPMPFGSPLLAFTSEGMGMPLDPSYTNFVGGTTILGQPNFQFPQGPQP